MSCVRLLHAFNSLFGSASTHYAAELQPALTRLKSQFIAPFFFPVKEIFFFPSIFQLAERLRLSSLFSPGRFDSVLDRKQESVSTPTRSAAAGC